MTQKNVIIIGTGIGGLATACLLGKKGYKVTLLEKNPKVVTELCHCNQDNHANPDNRDNR
jgi:flavin-dependent dehydrogenase